MERMWIRHGRARKDRDCRTTKYVRPGHSEVSRVAGGRGRGIGCNVEEYAWRGKKRKG